MVKNLTGERLKVMFDNMSFIMSRILHSVQPTLVKLKTVVLFTTYSVNKYIIYYLLALSTGVDGISSRMLKLAAPIIAPSITKLINLSFSLNVFSSRWKTAKVTPIFKGGCLRADVSCFLCCTRKKDVCITQSLIGFQRPAGGVFYFA